MNYFDLFRDIGIHSDTTKTEIKKIRLLNVFCLCWLAFLSIFASLDAALMLNPQANLICHGTAACLIVSIVVLQHWGYYFLARMILLITSAAVYVAFANLLEPNKMMEYFLILIPMIASVFIDQKWVNWLVLICSYLCFYIPILVFKHYPTLTVNAVSNFILFFAAFVIVNYFKNLNQKNETRLEEQRNEALLAKQKLEQQGNELKELYAFQNHFMVNLSHEIRTPLTLIKSVTNQLRKEIDDQKIEELNNKIDANSNKIKQLVDNIIDIAKMKSSKLEVHKRLFPIYPFAQKLVASFDSVFKERNIGLSIVKDNDANRFLVNGDKVYLERALSNLIMNAHKYSSSGDMVSVRLSTQNNVFSFEIEDTGCGIPEEDLDKIFLPFYRSQNSINQAGGSGVGLSFAQEVIALHDGKIAVTSTLGKGSVFAVELPCFMSDVATQDSFAINPKPLHGLENIEILLVEDNVDMQEYLKSVLSGFKVQIADNGQKALASIRNAVPDLIVTDYMMPEMDGYQLICEAKKMGIDCPVIVLTARMDENAKLDFLRLGIDDYLTKPFNQEELLIRVEHSLKNYANKKSLPDAEDASENADDIVNKAHKIVREHISMVDFGVTELAHSLSMNERTLNRKMKLATGMSPNSFIREVKLVEAKRILETNANTSLKEITLTMGFKNSSYFSELYEKRFGKKPTKGY